MKVAPMLPGYEVKRVATMTPGHGGMMMNGSSSSVVLLLVNLSCAADVRYDLEW